MFVLPGKEVPEVHMYVYVFIYIKMGINGCLQPTEKASFDCLIGVSLCIFTEIDFTMNYCEWSGRVVMNEFEVEDVWRKKNAVVRRFWSPSALVANSNFAALAVFRGQAICMHSKATHMWEFTVGKSSKEGLQNNINFVWNGAHLILNLKFTQYYGKYRYIYGKQVLMPLFIT